MTRQLQLRTPRGKSVIPITWGPRLTSVTERPGWRIKRKNLVALWGTMNICLPMELSYSKVLIPVKHINIKIKRKSSESI